MKYSNFTFSYSFGKNGFKTSITVNSNNPENALSKAKEEISGCYGSELFKDVVFY